MSLATRCTSCGTVFRVVQDQLKVSEGWVRCGQCDAVFNALEGLFDLGREQPEERVEASAAPAAPEAAAPESVVADLPPREAKEPSWWDEEEEDDEPSPPKTKTPSERSSADEKLQSSSFPTTAPAALEDLLADPIDAHLFRKRGAEATEKRPTVKVDERDRLEFSDARFDSDLFAENAIDETADPAEVPATGSADLPLESEIQQPDFIRRAERRARWRSTPVRVAVAVATLVGTLALALQAAHHFRDTVAARWPASRPMLVAWCGLADCTIEAPRRIDDVQVDSTALTRAIGLDAFVLSVTLKSRSTLPLAMPSVDLSLTDGNGRLVARRALSPRDFGAAAVVPAGAEVPLQLMLNAGSARVAGYTVEIFYP